MKQERRLLLRKDAQGAIKEFYMNRMSSIAIVLVSGLALSACQSNNVSGGPSPLLSGQNVGAVGGAVLGGLVGSQIGGGSGNVAATIAGAAIGGLLGGAIGQSIDQADRQRAQQAELQAVSTGRARSWRGQNSDAYGSIEPGEIYTSGTGNCREYTHTIFIQGRPQQGRGTACQNANGQWEIVG
jgi:surface antigen